MDDKSPFFVTNLEEMRGIFNKIYDMMHESPEVGIASWWGALSGLLGYIAQERGVSPDEFSSGLHSRIKHYTAAYEAKNG